MQYKKKLTPRIVHLTRNFRIAYTSVIYARILMYRIGVPDTYENDKSYNFYTEKCSCFTCCTEFTVFCYISLYKFYFFKFRYYFSVILKNVCLLYTKSICNKHFPCIHVHFIYPQIRTNSPLAPTVTVSIRFSTNAEIHKGL